MLFRKRRLTAEEAFALDDTEEQPQRPRRPVRDGLVRVGKLALKVFVAYYVLCVLLLVAYRWVSPPTTGVRIQRRLEGTPAREHHRVALTAMSKHAPRAVVVAEDGRFWKHWGYDLEEMQDASLSAVGGGRMRGASTITQQLVKNLFGCACRNPIRKVYDLTLTPAAEIILGKHRILELYLNEVEWGDGIYGIDAAARAGYGVGADRLTRTQSAGLAALLPNPRRRTLANTGAYRREIIRRMRYRGW